MDSTMEFKFSMIKHMKDQNVAEQEEMIKKHVRFMLRQHEKRIADDSPHYQQLSLQYFNEHYAKMENPSVLKFLSKNTYGFPRLSIEFSQLKLETYEAVIRNMEVVLTSIDFNSCYLEPGKNSCPVLLDLRHLKELRLTSSDHFMIRKLFHGAAKLEVLELKIDETWMGSCVDHLSSFIAKKESLKTLKIVNGDCKWMLLLESEKFQLESLVLKNVKLLKPTNFFEGQRKLMKVELTMNQMTEDEQIAIRCIINNNPHLESLKLVIKSHASNREFLDGVVANCNVKSLFFQEKIFEDCGHIVKLVRALPNLTQLELIGTGDADSDMEYCTVISGLQNIETLKLVGFDYSSLAHLRMESQNLKHVNLEWLTSYTKANEPLELFCGNHQTITDLEISFSPDNVTADHCQVVDKMLPNLKNLGVYNFDEPKMCVAFLMKSENLATLTMCETQFLEMHQSFEESKVELKFYTIEFPSN